METAAKPSTLLHKARHELVEFAGVVSYLYVCFGALIWFKSSILRSHGIAYDGFGIAILKALILGKFIMLIDMARIGDRGRFYRPIANIAWKACATAALLVILTAGEEVVLGSMRGLSAGASIRTIADGSLAEAFAVAILMTLILLPYFTLLHLRSALGRNGLQRLLLGRRSR